MKKQVLIAIFLLALFLRIYKLGAFPVGFHADEVRVGWNTYSILKTGKDDRGNTLALHYNTFGDFRPTGIFYLTIPVVALLGLTEFAIRFPSALLGALSVFPLVLLVREINRKTKIKNLEPLSALFLALSPWHISVSRATSEVAISLFLILFGLYFLLKRKYLASFLFLSISYFFYHTARVLVPLFAFATLLLSIKEFKKQNAFKKGVLVVGSLFLLTFAFTLLPEARGRFNQVSIFSDLTVQYELSRMPFEEGPNKIVVARLFHNKPLVYLRRFVNEYTNYFGAPFFLTDISKPGRYMTPGVGVLTYVEFGLLVLGFIYLAEEKKPLLPLILLLIAPFAAALTTEDSPNLHRAFMMVGFTPIIEAMGVVFLFGIFQKKQKLVGTLLVTLFSLNFIFYLHMYFVHAKYKIAASRNYGAKEVALYLNEVAKSYDTILLTNIPDDLYPWLAFYGKYDPAPFNKEAVKRKDGVWQYENFVFTSQRCPSRDAFEKPAGKKILVVDAVGCATESNLKERPDVGIVKEIKLPDESVGFTLWSNIY